VAKIHLCSRRGAARQPAAGPGGADRADARRGDRAGSEWERLASVLGAEPLARLLGISLGSARRYRASARATRGDVAGRLHLLALVVGDLSGADNDIGIRQWFARKRARLGGRAPGELLGGLEAGWAGPRRVRELARALTGSSAT
jgi:hypothetical protein